MTKNNLNIFKRDDLKNYEIIKIFDMPSQAICSALVVPKNKNIESSVLYSVDKRTNKGGFVDGLVANKIMDSSKEVWKHPKIDK